MIPNLISGSDDKYWREVRAMSELLSRAHLAGIRTELLDLTHPSVRRDLEKAIDASRDDWWGREAQRWIGL